MYDEAGCEIFQAKLRDVLIGESVAVLLVGLYPKQFCAKCCDGGRRGRRGRFRNQNHCAQASAAMSGRHDRKASLPPARENSRRHMEISGSSAGALKRRARHASMAAGGAKFRSQAGSRAKDAPSFP